MVSLPLSEVTKEQNLWAILMNYWVSITFHTVDPIPRGLEVMVKLKEPTVLLKRLFASTFLTVVLGLTTCPKYLWV